MYAAPRASEDAPQSVLRHVTELEVRFNEVDSYHIVWHGHYVGYLEVGREAFGAKYEIGYQHLLDRGVRAPIVHVDIDYRRSLKYGDKVRIVTEYIEKPQAKICFRYTLTSLDGRTVYCRGNTEQVLQDLDSGRTLPSFPDWHYQWLSRAKKADR
ncbi:acyl-CoA thioesterase [Lewinella lacunae]|uniref:Acyl-CoA thioesterase n=2 Tax=Neolewinella lacunae TaxID=1517758 RepID=A0A923TAX2_9BACT|nr:acyl-CoA thioesterase [Neolewinella lacunae]